jgi:hypothetical protein
MEPPPDRLPLVIGVTGHRDLREQDVPRLEQEVTAIIAGLRRDYLRNDRETPIIVLSALAEGADRLVARVALAQGAGLIAPLPMPLAEYRRDFEPGLQPGNMAEFDSLLAQAIAAPVMPLHASLEEIRSDPAKRAEQYREVGIFIDQHCHVLLALWDGDEKDIAVGGSAEVVMFKRNGLPFTVSGSARESLDASEIGPVIEVVTPRVKETSRPAEVAVRPWGRAVIAHYRGGVLRRGLRKIAAFMAHVLHREFADERSKLPLDQRRELESWESFDALLGLARRFNQDAARLAGSADDARRVTQSLDYLFTDADGGSIGDVDAKSRALDLAAMWCRLYAIADTLAQKQQRHFRWDWRFLFGAAFMALVFFSLYAHGHDLVGISKSAPLIGYIASCVAIFLLFGRAKLGRHQERFLDYRALAEALRVAVYWKLVGIGSRYADAKAGTDGAATIDLDPAGPIADAYPIKQPSELAWVKICLRTLERLDRAEGGLAHKIEPIGHAIARRFWVRGQHDYFKRQGLRHNTSVEAVESRALVLLVVSPLLVVPVLAGWVHGKPEDMLAILTALLPGYAAASTGYSERLAFKAQARQYDRMRMLFERAHELLPTDLDEASKAQALALYRELGMEAMRENAEWVAIYRQRPIQPLQ